MTTDEEVSDFLEHFGVRGMHWGIRNKRPVSAERQAKRDVKAAKYMDKAAVFQTNINELNLKKGFSIRRKAQIRNFTEKRNQAVADAQAKRSGHLTDKQRKVVKGAAIVGTLVAAKLTYNALQSGEAHNAVERGKAFIHGGTPSFKKNAELAAKDLNADEIMSKVVKDINPSYGEFGSKMNCRRCTFAYEMRRRGNEVRATRTTNARGQNAGGLYNALTPGEDKVRPGAIGVISRQISERVKAQHNPNLLEAAPFTTSLKQGNIWGREAVEPGDIFKAIAKHPNGARGELGVQWNALGGHSMAWEVVKGKPVVFDAQTGKKFASLAELTKEIDDKGLAIGTAGITRLDNVALDESFLGRWVTNAA